MTTETRILLDHSISAADLLTRLRPDEGDPRFSVRRLADYLRGVAGGFGAQTVQIAIGAVRATATLTFTDDPAANGTFVLAGVTFTGKASGASTREWNITSGGTSAADAAANASSVATLVNADADVGKLVSASHSAGVVTFTAVLPGDWGNGLVLTESLTNATRVDFAGGDDGDLFDLDLT